ncbi:MAG: ribosomal-processing cysteine protease Prp, partial [Oscillospiraceae bacterium]|nr:ribosomal-processing cysteine protease Prp [Oscillospiraceae bacterium]
MTRAIYDREQLRLTLEGHAGAGPRGDDLVCAALSMLAMTLERRVREREEEYLPAVSRGPGR